MRCIIYNLTSEYLPFNDLGDGFNLEPDASANLSELFTLDELNRCQSIAYHHLHGNISLVYNNIDVTTGESIEELFSSLTMGDVKYPDSTVIFNVSADATSIHGYLIDYPLETNKALVFNGSKFVYVAIPDLDDLIIYEGELYCWDSVRSCYLSVTSYTYQFGRAGSVDGDYLYRTGGVSSNLTGYLLEAKMRLIVMTVKHGSDSAASSKQFHVRKNAVSDNIYSLTTSSYKGKAINIDVSFNEDDYLSIYVDSSGSSVNNPLAVLKFKKELVE